MASLSLKHIYKVYPNGTKAVNDFNMEIEDKEFIVFVGPSGCGKSTTLRMIAGLEEISAGELRIGDTVVNDLEPKERDIAMVFQNYALYPHMTIYANMAFGLQMQKMPKAEIDRRVREAAEILGITEYLKRKPKEMSGGQRQRVALGRAIVREPKVMLLDEPLSNLDAKLRTQMRSEIVKLHHRLNTTFVYVTHDQVEAMTMGSRIVVMKLGFVQQIDTPKNLYLYPANKFVAGFIGTPQMNFLDCTLKREGERVHVVFSGCEAQIDVPLSALLKVAPRYLDGQKKVCLGVRAEDITLDRESVLRSETKIKIKVSHVEELGTETLVYGDLDLNYDGIAETATRVVLKAAGFNALSSGDIVEAAINLGAIHLFDAETEESILPRIPKENVIPCKIFGGKLCFGNVEIPLPPAISCENGEAELILPTDAISLGGDVPATLCGCEEIDENRLSTLDMGGVKVFAVAKEAFPEACHVRFDMKKIGLRRGESKMVAPMPEKSRLEGRFVMEKLPREKGAKKEAKYSMEIAGVKLEAPKAVADKMFAAFSGRKVFNTQFIYEFSPYDVRLAEDGIAATVKTVLDYGGEKFLLCTVGGEDVYVHVENAAYECGREVHLQPDPEKLGVIEKSRDIRIV